MKLAKFKNSKVIQFQGLFLRHTLAWRLHKTKLIQVLAVNFL